MIKKLHIVSFDVPFPANYGGVIDVFYKIKALHKLGVKIHLHTYEYGRGKAVELEEFCYKITYYQRTKSLKNLISRKPFIVKTRNSEALIQNLKKGDDPILFEGLHTTFPIIKNGFKNKYIMVRTHNIEHKYYDGLAKSENRFFKKRFFKTEARKLKYYESILKKVDKILTISPFEQNYFQKKYGEKATYIPVFHKNKNVINLSEKGDYALYHGDLRVSDNEKAVLYLIKVFKELNYNLVIASSYKNDCINSKIDTYKNVTFEFLCPESEEQLTNLFKKAHINVLPTFQKTGIKLKLIHALFASRFCIVNNEMIEDTGLEPLCEIANTKKEFREKIAYCFSKKYTTHEIENRKKILVDFNALKNAKKIISIY
ncbi:MAG: glycosyltransferase [Flavobacteriaceae bacterium]|nr:glycosyltransferase [Flavobacteriaceae bacterium]